METEVKAAIEALPPLEVWIGDTLLTITPQLFLQAANLRVTHCKGCVEWIGYTGDGTGTVCRIRWLGECAAQGSSSLFSVVGQPGLIPKLEDAANNCKQVTVSFQSKEDGSNRKILFLIVGPTNPACCRCPKEDESGKPQRRVF